MTAFTRRRSLRQVPGIFISGYTQRSVSSFGRSLHRSRVVISRVVGFKFVMASFSKSACCGVCEKAVSGRQQALECDRCRRWIHRLCGTGMSQDEYRRVARLLKNGGQFSWTCGHCSLSASTTSDDRVAVPDAGDSKVDVDHIGPPVLESTRLAQAAKGFW